MQQLYYHIRFSNMRQKYIFLLDQLVKYDISYLEPYQYDASDIFSKTDEIHFFEIVFNLVLNFLALAI